jgi:hypothetical protein
LSSSPSYVVRSGEQVYCPPFAATGTRLYAFAVKSDMDAQRANICDRYLNQPLGVTGRFLPALDQVFIVFNSIDALRCTSPDWADKGWFTEQEAAVWMLVADLETDRLFWFHPYMLVDNAYALCMGREIYGFPKCLGWFVLPPGPDAPGSLSVETVGVKNWGADSQGLRQPLFEVRRTSGPSVGQLIDDIADVGQLMGEVLRMSELDVSWFEKLGLAAHFMDDLMHLRLPMVFLKQFRDGLDPTATCYQAVQEVNVQLTHFQSARIYAERFELLINDLASHPMRADFGFADGPIAVEYGFWTLFDFTIGPCTQVWPTRGTAA